MSYNHYKDIVITYWRDGDVYYALVLRGNTLYLIEKEINNA